MEEKIKTVDAILSNIYTYSEDKLEFNKIKCINIERTGLRMIRFREKPNQPISMIIQNKIRY